jgi:hypothetical protein
MNINQINQDIALVLALGVALEGEKFLDEAEKIANKVLKELAEEITKSGQNEEIQSFSA